MTKKEQKTRQEKKDIIVSRIGQCAGIWSAYTYGHIPRDKYLNACQAYAGKVAYDDVFGLIDETVFGSGKKGMLFSSDGFYYSGNNKFHSYKEGINFKALNSGYNLTATNEMLKKLYLVDSAPSTLDTAGELIGMFIDSSDNIDKVGNFLESIDGLIGKVSGLVNTCSNIRNSIYITEDYEEVQEEPLLIEEQDDEDD